ncbi:hypothetical protein MTR_6g073797 [Medicago truncatula]|uniref:Uncharacterized protein n=1 Tax=Medicago truncatula TaxID=3880 RepID=A0A072UAI9_MEDTR|nr:hypothetical protein MTR_6g073797 [Medicago truncatula]
MTQSMPCVQYRHEGKRVIIHMIIITESQFVRLSFDIRISDSGEASKIRLSILNEQLLKLLMFDCRIRLPNYTRVVLSWLINCFQEDCCDFEQFVRLSFDIRIW